MVHSEADAPASREGARTWVEVCGALRLPADLVGRQLRAKVLIFGLRAVEEHWGRPPTTLAALAAITA